MKGYKRKMKASVFLMLLACICMLWPGKVYAEAQDENLAIVGAMDSGGEALDIFNGLMVDVGNKTMVISSSGDAWNTAAGGRVVGVNGEASELDPSVIDPDAGVAIFYATNYCGGFPANMSASFTSLYEGETVYYCGLDFNASGENLSDMVAINMNTIKGAQEIDGYTFVVLNDAVDEMYAGGPVYTEDGLLVGITVIKNSTAMFLPIDYLADAMGVSLDSGGSSGGAGGSGDTGGGTGGSGGSGGGTGGSGGSGGSGGGTGGSGGSGGSGGGTGGTGGTSGIGGGTGEYGYSSQSSSPVVSTLFLILFFSALVAFVVSTIVHMNQEMRKKAAGIPEFADFFAADTAGGIPGAGARAIQGMNGYFSGRSLPLGQGPVIFGRDAKRCSAVYPSNTKGVSGLHCRVEQAGPSVVLTDLGSTYGTFLKNGTRLTANVPYNLHSGDEFYLAEPANTFQII